MTSSHSFDELSLTAYLESQIDGFKGPCRYTKFADGQSNPTFKLDAASGTYVLRRQPAGKLLKSAHAVDREFRVIKALANSQVPVPKVLHLCEDINIIGSMFYVMEFCDGNIHWSPALESVESNEQRRAMHFEVIETLAAIHSVDLEATELTDYGRPGNYFGRQLDRWSSQYRASETRTIAAMDSLIEALATRMPDDDGKVSLVHGDYRFDNMIFDKSNSKVIAVLDWELSTLGHPLADLAYFCMALRLPENSNGDLTGLMGVDRHALGIPEEHEMVAHYCNKMNIDAIDDWPFYLAFSFFRLAAIAQGVAKRALDGNASSKKAAAAGAIVEPLSSMALQVLATTPNSN